MQALLTSFVHYSSIAAIFFFFNDTATTEIYTLSLHDALPISAGNYLGDAAHPRRHHRRRARDRKSTRLNSSHDQISYAVFCLKKKKKNLADYLLPQKKKKSKMNKKLHNIF